MAGSRPWISAGSGVILEIFVDRERDIERRARWNGLTGQCRAVANVRVEQPNKDRDEQEHPSNPVHTTINRTWSALSNRLPNSIFQLCRVTDSGNFDASESNENHIDAKLSLLI